MSPISTFNGRCHCGAVRFEVDAVIDNLRECDCSICRQRGALIVRVEADAFRLLTPIEELSVYRWGTMTGADYFCTICGIMPFRRPSSLTRDEVKAGMTAFHGWAINARCIEGLDLSSLPRIQIRGSEIEI